MAHPAADDDDDDDALFGGGDDEEEEDEDENIAPPPTAATTTKPASAAATTPVLLGAEDDAMDEDEDEDMPLPPSSAQQQQQQQQSSIVGAGTGAVQPAQSIIISQIITPSPYAHHNAGPTSSRFRNALHRVTLHPTTDVEAWTALMTEVQNCWRQILSSNSIHGVHANIADPTLPSKLDWVESCYGNLLLHFPYAFEYATSLCEILLVQSARFDEEHGPITHVVRAAAKAQLAAPPTQRALQAEAKLEGLLEKLLGYRMDGTPVASFSTSSSTSQSETTDDDQQQEQSQPVCTGLCSWVVDLWLLYIKKRQRDATRRASVELPVEQRRRFVQDETQKAYELAIQNCGFVHDNHMLWKAYLDYVRSWEPQAAADQLEPAQQQQVQQHVMQTLRNINQRLVCLPMTGLDKFWHDYEAWERSQSEQLAQALITELAPKYQHARSVYLERNRVYNVQDLQLVDSQRLATPPASSIDLQDDANKASGGGAGAGVGGGTGGAADAAATESKERDVAAKMQEEDALLTLWKKRCSYERTNPERLPSKDLAVRIRAAFMQQLCVLTRHPECWHGWSQWELLREGGASSMADEKTQRAVAVLRLAQQHIPDCTLLAYAEAQVVELFGNNNNNKTSSAGSSSSSSSSLADKQLQYTGGPAAALAVMERFLDRSPTTLGYVLYQQMVRRYKGMAEARAVFGKARRVLVDQEEFVKMQADKRSKLAASKQQQAAAAGGDDDEDAAAEGGEGETTAEGTASSTPTGTAAASTTTKEADNGKKRWMVTNRLDPSIGTHQQAQGATTSAAAATDGEASTAMNGDTTTHAPQDEEHHEAAGPITWHLYASHANIEHRLNRAPEVAARVYELGLRKHASFLTKPAYVMRYSQLLLELGDTMNLRALLTRAVATCEAQDKKDALASLWDMTLHFETLISGGKDQGSIASLRKIEQRRREALMGPEVEDVATGGIVGMGETTLIGAQKSTIAEHLIRSEGYDLSSNIVNGMGRTVDVLEVMGLWGSGEYDGASSASRRRIKQSAATAALRNDDAAMTSGSKSDASFHKRLEFRRMRASGMTYDSMLADGTGGASSKILSARERLQQGAGAGATGAGPTTAMMLAIQQMPEWLRPLLLLLPASRLRFPVVAKPPPHLTEMALTMLRQNPLPAERPADEVVSGSKRKLQDKSGGDSSDEDDTGIGGSGYGNTFRARQRARMAGGGGNGQQANGGR